MVLLQVDMDALMLLEPVDLDEMGIKPDDRENFLNMLSSIWASRPPPSPHKS
jgi:hypothetical protein